MTSEIQFYLKIFLRRAHWFILIFGIFTAASLTVARMLPAVYVSSSQLLVEPPEIPSQLAASTVQTTALEELQIIQQRLMTRVNLLEIARTEGVFPDIGTMTADEIDRAMRDATNILISAGNGQATLMEISFESENAAVTAAVVNRYVTIVMQANTSSRTEQASNTLEFFEVEVERLGTQLEELSAQLLKFNNDNKDALPSTLGFRLNQQGNLQAQIATFDRDIAMLKDQKQTLIDVFASTGTVTQSASQAVTPEQQKLAQLESQLSAALAVYSPTNPKVKMLEAQVAQQQEVVRIEAGVASQATAEGQSTPPATSILDAQLASIDGQIETLETQRQVAQEALDIVAETIERTPGVQIELDALTRDYNNVQTQYNNAVSGLAAAATGERIEVLAKGQRISIIDPATVPSRPARPNRLLIAAGGAGFGAFLGLGVIGLLEFLNRSIRRPVEITRSLGITPLATVPYILTPFEQFRRRAIYAALFLGLIIGVPALVYAVHTYYLPLDLIYERIASRFGTIL